MESSTVRVRPLRFAFLADPRDKRSLLQIFELNSSLWGGVFNFIIPLLKRVPKRYREQHFRTIPANQMLNGLVEAFQPDFIVEMKVGSAASYGIEFDSTRTIQFDDQTGRDERGRCKLGTDLRSVCEDLYDKSFRFVQRHPPEVIISSSSDPHYTLLFAAAFGYLPKVGALSDVADVYLAALDGKRKEIDPVDFPSLYEQKCLYPLRLTANELDTKRNSWSIDSKLFYMDERSSFDLIEFWNLRALGWDIAPLPAKLSPRLIGYCNQFIKSVYRPYPPPSNAFHHATVLCGKSRYAKALEFISKLTWPPPQFAAVDNRVPRLWEEWGQKCRPCRSTDDNAFNKKRRCSCYWRRSSSEGRTTRVLAG
jgi:hypothetical protein